MTSNPFDKPFDDVTEADLLSLVENQVAERKTIEYKRELPSNTDDAKKEFLADITSFANASGGFLIFGIPEESGLPTEITGISCRNPDQEILRLENIIRDGIKPRISGLSTRAILLNSGLYIIIHRIPRSWSLPHVVDYKGHWRFYSRNSAGKYPLDVMEVRSAFAQSIALTDKIRLFRNERLGSIIADQTPVNLQSGARIVLHLIPYTSFDPAGSYSLDAIARDPWIIRPVNRSVSGHRYNIDGYLTVYRNGNDYAQSYVQIFRNGIFEAVDTTILKVNSDQPIIPSILFEQKLIEAVQIFLDAQKKMDVPPPIVLMLSLLGVSGFIMAVKPSLDICRVHQYLVDRDTLLLPEIIFDSFPSDVSSLLKPAFDAVWNAAGWPQSLSYNEQGEWGKGPNI